MAIPRSLTNRNPRDPRHIAEAFRIIEEVSGTTYVLRSTVKELSEAGVTLPKNVKIAKRITKDNLLVGGSYLVERGIQAHDNVITKCTDCGAAIEFRPALANANGIHICLFCAVDRQLKDYWADKNGK